jgi:CBS domain containing-hemolysin-like protein
VAEQSDEVTQLLAASLGPKDAIVFCSVVILLGLSALLALAETSLVRTSRSRARALVEKGARGARSLSRLVEHPERFLAPVLLLVLICQLVSATLIGVEAVRLFGALGVAVATVFEVIVVFIFAEAIPKHWAVRNPDRAALFAAPIVSAVISFPPIHLVASALIGLSRLFAPESDSESGSEITESELLALADVAAEEDVIEDEERALITSIIAFGDTIVREVMAPRPDIVAVDRSMPAGAVLERAMTSGLSRIPVFAQGIDDIVGIAYTRDCMRAVRDGNDKQPIASLCRQAHFVPETKRVAPLLREMQHAQFHLAVVVDEYGGTAGIVTLEDLIEELIGDIADEFDVDEPLIQPVSDGEYRVSGKMAVDEVNELLGATLPVGDWDTIGGLLMHLRGQVPAEGESLETEGLVLIAEKVQRRRVGTVHIVDNSVKKNTPIEQDR